MVTAILPIKSNSERVVGKNFRELGGRPLYTWLLETLQKCREVDQIIVDTDSIGLHAELAQSYPDVVRRVRPEGLASPTTSMDEVLVALAKDVSDDIFVQLHVTNPFLSFETIDGAISKYKMEGRGTLMSVSEIRARLWSSEMEPLNHNPSVMERTQDMRPILKENSCFFVFSRSGILESGNRVSGKISTWTVSDLEAMDIDTEDDFYLADMVARSWPQR